MGKGFWRIGGSCRGVSCLRRDSPVSASLGAACKTRARIASARILASGRFETRHQDCMASTEKHRWGGWPLTFNQAD